MRTLIVDDLEVYRDTYLLRILNRILPAPNSLTVFTASSIEEALPLIETEEYHIIIMDYGLGRPFNSKDRIYKNGADLVKRRREIENTKIISRSCIIGHASTSVGNAEIQKGGANTAFHKLKVED